LIHIQSDYRRLKVQLSVVCANAMQQVKTLDSFGHVVVACTQHSGPSNQQKGVEFEGEKTLVHPFWQEKLCIHFQSQQRRARIKEKIRRRTPRAHGIRGLNWQQLLPLTWLIMDHFFP
jgi:hypothetical protein